ncbi:SOS response-associated peptidase family protein [Paenibacillus sp. LS1]|uniref:SOS response-associated peptidase family protein n=1 Tax=Paenibacillus sp. LS1 TaxID=2992120 RepID=UPI0039B6ED41
MPVILRPEDVAEWLGRDYDDVQSLLGLLKPYQASEMRAYEVPKEGAVRLSLLLFFIPIKSKNMQILRMNILHA